MNNRKLVITYNLSQNLLDQVKELIPGWELIASKEQTVWQEHVKDAEVIAGWKSRLDEYCLGQDSKLKWLQTWSAGVDSLPLKKLAAANIFLTSANGVHAYPISETIFAMILGLTRKIHTYVKNQQEKVWHHAQMKQEIHEKTIGIIGVGAIGSETAKIAKAFGMKVLGVRSSDRPAEFVDKMYTASQLHLVLPQCDYVVVTLPHTKETHHLFGAEQFKQMKPSTYFINIGRGQIVIEDALVQALQEGTIAGAGLDVFETEPLNADSPLWEMDNVIITPHTAGSTEHYDQRVVENILIPNLKNYLSGQKPSVNLVDYSKGY
ncbi:D-2-hydroxyacid dehydrogenase [Neobacillus sp. OS1-32]|uniref:D-2-hydroxyacid dehydrogenase n=1 Tax=Neobacillus sp. OS1-32 TaxID=3070682 RepID=UPI0027E05F83|nr:D-2-hydroxyacid dehydrogenase [Neobacillus sp. OS1-32]WML28735.1 D-2-hydroxyacid dehydrogenase [Neobacillus sp. OS1-32]